MADKEKRAFLLATHPVYDAWRPVWLQNERRLRGGSEVLVELTPFRWEVTTGGGKPGKEYEARQKKATYINFCELHASIVAGHLMREAPTAKQGVTQGGSLSFGTLGSVDLSATTPDPAALLYHNVDGAGVRGSQWDQWWLSLTKRALATGHRWVYVDSTATAPLNAQDELNGLRPFAVELSPLSVPNWDDQNGVFNFFVVVTQRRVFRLDPKDGSVVNNGKPEKSYLLLVRKGYDALNFEGDDFSGGGWWLFDQEREHVKGADGKPLTGSWDSTEGVIPMFPAFAEQDSGSEEMPAISRPMLTSLGQVSVSYMDLSSAADYDVWDGGSSAKYIEGIDPDAHKEVVRQELDGSKTIGIPWITDGEGKVLVPRVTDSAAGVVQADAWDRRLQNKWEEARVLAAIEATGEADTSGVSKQMSFADIMAPRLANVAANLEMSQTNLIHFMELRWRRGVVAGPLRPTGSATWPREFNLQDIVSDIRTFFTLEGLAGVKNPKLAAKLLVRALEELALEADPAEREALLNEYRALAVAAEERRQQEQDALANAGFGE